MTCLRTFATFAVGLLACLPGVAAQNQQGQFLAAAPASASPGAQGGLFLVDPVAATVQRLPVTGALVDSYTVACDALADDVVWVGTTRSSSTTAPAIFRVRTAGGQILAATEVKIGLTAADATVRQLRTVGDDLMFLTDRRLAMVAKSGGNPVTLFDFGPTTGQPRSFATNGWITYVAVSASPSASADQLYWFDMSRLYPVRFYLANPTVRISSLSIEADEDLVVVESDTSTKAAELKLFKGLVVTRTVRLPFPDGALAASIDNATGDILVSGQRFDTTRQRLTYEFAALRNWTVTRPAFGNGIEPWSSVDVRRDVNLHRHGHACRSVVSQQPLRVCATGQPSPGKVYQLSLFGDRSATALVLFGLHGQLASPISLAPMGAGTCVLGVTSVVEVLLGLDLNGLGQLQFTIPLNAPRTVVDVQWLATSPLANPANFLSSQVGSIVIR
ncbi:MAG: hypothetical protein KDC87_16275 [Planctomycetes bacterium]|nr:hypothetical protein [Planctomycetota bacterium]